MIQNKGRINIHQIFAYLKRSYIKYTGLDPVIEKKNISGKFGGSQIKSEFDNTVALVGAAQGDMLLCQCDVGTLVEAE